MHKAQRPEGGWFGSWGICFTYATQFALESLSLAAKKGTTSLMSSYLLLMLVLVRSWVEPLAALVFLLALQATLRDVLIRLTQ